MRFKLHQFFLKGCEGWWNLRAYAARQGCDDVFHPDIEVGINDIQSRIQGLYFVGYFINGQIMFHDIINTGLYFAVNCFGGNISQFVNMNKAPVLVTASVDGNLAQKVGLEQKAVDHCVYSVGWIVTVDISRPEDDHLPVPVEYIDLFFTIPF